MAQSNTVARTFVEATRTITGLTLPLWVPGLLITVMVGLVLLGGIRASPRSPRSSCPAMLLLYVITTLIYIVLNAGQLPTCSGSSSRRRSRPPPRRRLRRARAWRRPSPPG
jgi:Na+/alanine symporter